MLVLPVECLLEPWFRDVSSHATFWEFAAASLQPLTTARCFETLRSDRFDGLLVWWVFVGWSFVLFNSSSEMCGLAGFWIPDS